VNPLILVGTEQKLFEKIDGFFLLYPKPGIVEIYHHGKLWVTIDLNEPPKIVMRPSST